jgi:hypothetical protein
MAYHAQAHALVRVYQVREDLGRCGDGDTALVSELVETTLHAEICEPVLAVLPKSVPGHIILPKCTYSSTTGHGSQQAVVDLNDLLDRLTRYPVSGGCSRVGGYDDAALEAEGKGRGTVGNLDRAVGVGVVVRHCAQP